jgi:hypothetical protein
MAAVAEGGTDDHGGPRNASTAVHARLRTPRIGPLSQCFGVLKKINEIITLHFAPDRLVVYKMDDRQTLVLHFEITAEEVARGGGSYECFSGDFFGDVNVNVFMGIIANVKNNRDISIEVVHEPGGLDVLRIWSCTPDGPARSAGAGAGAGARHTNFDICIMQADVFSARFPDFASVKHNRCVLPSVDLYSAITMSGKCHRNVGSKPTAAHNTNAVALYMTQDDLVVQSVGLESKYSQNIPAAVSSAMMHEASSLEITDSVYPHLVLLTFLRAYTVAPNIEVCLAHGFPLRLSYLIDGLGTFEIFVVQQDILTPRFKEYHRRLITERRRYADALHHSPGSLPPPQPPPPLEEEVEVNAGTHRPPGSLRPPSQRRIRRTKAAAPAEAPQTERERGAHEERERLEDLFRTVYATRFPSS